MTLVTAPVSERIAEALRLARALCMGTAAFFVAADGAVEVDLSRAETFPDRAARIEALARGSMSRPGALGHEPFWNTEVLAASELAEESLACVAVPVRSGTKWLGLLGVVDTWLPELDEEQRQGLARLSEALGHGLGGEVAPADQATAGPAEPGETLVATAPTAEPATDHLRVEEPPSAQPAQEPPPAETPGEVPPIPGTPARKEPPADRLLAGETSGRPPIETVAGEGLLGEIAEHVPEPLLVAKADGTILFANPAMQALTGRSASRILGVNVSILLRDCATRPTGATEPSTLASLLLGAAPPGRRLHLTTAEGRAIGVDVSGAGFESRLAGECYIALIRLPGVGLATRAGLEDDAPRALLDALDQGIVVCDRAGTIVIANRAAWGLLGLAEDEDLVGFPFPFTAELCASDGSALARAHHPLARALEGTIVRSEHLQLTTRDGENRHLVASAKPFMIESGIGALLILRDVTSQLAEESRLMDLALHDPLTGLANRYLLLDYLRRVLLQFRTRGGSIALVFLDLDDFKMVNDTFGHDAGDELLVAVGRRIQRAVRSSDIVARLGGDEFAVALAASEEAGELDLVVSRIRHTLTAAYQIQGRTLAVSASLGWVTADPRYVDPATLLVRADREMYRRKRARRQAQLERSATEGLASGEGATAGTSGGAELPIGASTDRRRSPSVGEEVAF